MSAAAPESHTPTERLWAALLASTLLNLPLGSVYAFSVLLRPLEQELGITRSALSLVFGVATAGFTVGSVSAPWLYRLAPAPVLVFACAVAASAGVAVAALAHGLPQLLLGYSIVFGTGGGVAYILLQQGVNMLVRGRRGLINGYIVSLYPMGAMIATPAFHACNEAFGWRVTLGGLAAVGEGRGALLFGHKDLNRFVSPPSQTEPPLFALEKADEVVGGGSLELIDIRGPQLGLGETYPLGGIRLEESAGRAVRQAEKIVSGLLSDSTVLKGGKGRVFYAVGGTWRSLARLHIAQRGYPLRIMHHHAMTGDEALEFCRLVARHDIESLPAIEAVSKSRRPLLPYGAAVMEQLIRVMQPQMPCTGTTHRKPMQHHSILVNPKSTAYICQCLKNIRFTGPAIRIIATTIDVQLQPLPGSLCLRCTWPPSIHPFNKVHLVHLISSAMQHNMHRPASGDSRIHSIRQCQCIRLNRTIHGTDIATNRSARPQMPVRSPGGQPISTATSLRQHTPQLVYPAGLRILTETQHPDSRFFIHLNIGQQLPPLDSLQLAAIFQPSQCLLQFLQLHSSLSQLLLRRLKHRVLRRSGTGTHQSLNRYQQPQHDGHCSPTPSPLSQHDAAPPTTAPTATQARIPSTTFPCTSVSR